MWPMSRVTNVIILPVLYLDSNHYWSGVAEQMFGGEMIFQAFIRHGVGHRQMRSAHKSQMVNTSSRLTNPLDFQCYRPNTSAMEL